MKKIILVLVMIFAINGFSQKRSAKHQITVDGVCEMCKERIEKASLGTKGVKFATWSVDTHQLTVIINEKKTTIKKLKQNIAKVGHDTDEVKATQEIYDNMHECCKYRDEEVQKSHKDK